MMRSDIATGSQASRFWFWIVDDPSVVKIEDVKRAVCAHFGITKEELLSYRRDYDCVYPRHVGMYLSKSLSTKSFTEIARRFSRTDHTTIIRACGKIRRMVATDRLVAREVAQIREMLV
jgi:chromosomal replication initiator protein